METSTGIIISMIIIVLAAGLSLTISEDRDDNTNDHKETGNKKSPVSEQKHFKR